MFAAETYGDMAGEEMMAKYQTVIYLAGSASAEFVADIALCPFEAVKVRLAACAIFPIIHQGCSCSKP